MPAEVLNTKGLIKSLRKLEADKSALRDLNKEAAEIVLPVAKREAPRGQGALVASGRVTGQLGAGVVRFGNAKVRYARAHHFGHANRSQGGFVRPDPYIFRAVDETEDEVFDHYTVETGELVRRRLGL